MIILKRLLPFILFCLNDIHIIDCCTNPYDKKVVLLQVRNEGFTPVSHTVTYNVGTSSSKGTQKGKSESSGQTSNSQSTIGANVGINIPFLSLGGQASFTNSLGTSKETGFNWGSTSSDTFNKDTSHNYNFQCPAFKICKVTQVVGYCNGLEIKAPQIDVIHELIQRNDKVPAGIPDAVINVPDEVWIIAKNLTFGIRSGTWERTEACPGGSRVQGFHLKSKQLSGMLGYLLICSKQNENGELVNTTQIQSGEVQGGTWHTPLESFFEDTYAVGFVYETWRNPSGKLYKGNWKLMMEKVDVNLHPPDWAVDVDRHEIRCPRMHEICGIQTMLSKDRDVVSDIGLKCCYHCEPREGFVVKDSYSNEGSTRVDLSYSITIGTSNTKDTSSSKNQQSDQSENTQGVHFSGLRAGFEATFGKSSSSGFNWASSSNKMWSSNENKVISWSCPPFTLCTLKQLVGYCGTEEVVQTPHKTIDHKRLKNYQELLEMYSENNQEGPGDGGDQDYSS